MRYEITDYWVEPIPYSPEIRDYKRLWDSHYSVKQRNEEIQWNRHYHRFPEVLCPEYNVWYWRTIGHWYYKARYELWYSKPIQAMVQGYYPGYYKRVGFWNKFGRVFHFMESTLRGWIGWSKYTSIHWEECLECGYKYDFLNIESDWFYFTGGGTRFTGEYTQHWFVGLWTCPRCLKQWEYEDSD